jgi:hypothetical protein
MAFSFTMQERDILPISVTTFPKPGNYFPAAPKKKTRLFGSLMWIGGFLFLLSLFAVDKCPSAWSISAYAASFIWFATFGLLYSAEITFLEFRERDEAQRLSSTKD